MQFVFQGTLDELIDTIRTKSKALHKDIVVYHDKPDILRIGFQRLGHSGGRFFVADVLEKDDLVILNGDTRNIFPQKAPEWLYRVWGYIDEFLLDYLALGFMPWVVWFFVHEYVSIWIPLLFPFPMMVLLELKSRKANANPDDVFYQFMTMVTSGNIAIPTNSQELYNMLMNTQGLHSFPQIKDDMITWELYQNVCVKASISKHDTIIDIVQKNIFQGSYMHWHPELEDMYEELVELGKKGNILVLRKFLNGAEIYYVGEPDKYRFSPKKKWHWGKLVYLKQQES